MEPRQILYVKGADGRMYEQIPSLDEPGEFVYEPAEPGLTFKEAPTRDGRFIAVRDAAEHARHGHHVQANGRDMFIASPTTHAAHFGKEFTGEGFEEVDAAKAKQHLKKLSVLEKQMMSIQAVRQDDAPGAASVEVVTDEKFFELHETYKAAAARGEQNLVDFTPVAVYSARLMNKKTGKMIRPLMRGEVGIRPNGTIVVLEKGFGSGNLIAVPKGFQSAKPDIVITGIDDAKGGDDKTVVTEFAVRPDGGVVIAQSYTLPKFGVTEGDEVEPEPDVVLDDPFPEQPPTQRIVRPAARPAIVIPPTVGIAASGEEDEEEVAEFKPRNSDGVEEYHPRPATDVEEAEAVHPTEYNPNGGPRRLGGFGRGNEPPPGGNRRYTGFFNKG